MKTPLLCVFFIFLFSPFFANEVLEIPRSDVESIALRNAEAIWGKVNPDNPIPMYDQHNRLVAWQFNFALSTSFPHHKDLLDRLKIEDTDLSELEKIGEEFGYIIVGARTDQPPIIGYSNGLSEHYDSYYTMDELARNRFSPQYQLEREIFLSMGSEWFVVSSGEGIRYIKASPPFFVCTRDEFVEKANHPDYPQKKVDYSGEWQAYLEGQVLNRDYVFIEDKHLMPFISYCYGCTPTSGAMLNEYYRNKSPNIEGHFTKLITKYTRRFDQVSAGTRYHVSDAHSAIADYMGTESTYTGATLPWLISIGMEDFYNSRGHDYWGGVYSWHWNYLFSNSDMFDDLKHEINYNYPALMNTFDHTICAMGYNNSTNMVAAHDPNSTRITYWNISNFYFLTKVHPRPITEGAHINLLAPDGGQGWLDNGPNPILRQNSVQEIRWDGDLLPDTFVDIHYGTEAINPVEGTATIVQDHPNTGYYPWLIPANLESESVRVLLHVKNNQGQNLGYDCSWGEFTVTTGGSVSQLDNGQVYSMNSELLYSRIDTPNSTAAWAVAGLRKSTNAPSSIDVWNQNFSSQKTTSTESGKLNWVVIDKNHAPDIQMGLRTAVEPDDSEVHLQFEGGDQHLSWGSNNFSWNAGEIVRAYDVQLQPGLNTFSLNHNSGFGNMGMALYGSQDSWYLPKSAHLGYSDDNPGLGRETFSIWIYEADVYGLVIWANTNDAYGNFTLNIGSSGMWTGAVSNAWNVNGNWASGTVPTISDDVFIPAGAGVKPYLDGGINALCHDLIIANGAWITVANADLYVTGSAKIYGEFKTTGSSQITFVQSVIWYDGSTLSDLGTSEFQALRDWTVRPNASVLMSNSSLRFAGTENSVMHILGQQNMFSNLLIHKGSTGTVAINAATNIKVDNLTVNTPLSFLGDSILDISNALSTNGGLSFQTGKLNLVGSGTKTINCIEADQFYNLDLTGNAIVNGNLRALGSVRLLSGYLSLGTNTMSVTRNLSTEGGQFAVSNYRIKFTGAASSTCNLAYIRNLELAKYSNGELIIPEGANFTCNSYDWTSGSIRVQSNASFAANDLADMCIKGRYYLEGGTIELYQDDSHGVDLDADLFIYSGTFNVYGGYNFPSEWAYTRAISVHMEGGVLDFKDRGIKLATDGFYLQAEISGGTIRTTGDFIVERFGFNPSGGTIELYGSGTAYARIADPSAAHNLTIQKSGRTNENIPSAPAAKSLHDFPREYDLRTNQVIFDGSSRITNNLLVSTGTMQVTNCTVTIENDLVIHGACNLAAANDRINVNGNVLWQSTSSGTISNGVISVARNWTYHAQSSASVTAPAQIQFVGSTNSFVQLNQANGADLGNLQILKESASCTVNSSSGDPQIHLGYLQINSGSTFYPGNGIYQITNYLRIEPEGTMYIQSASMNTPDFKQFGQLNMLSGTLHVDGFFRQYSGSLSQISGGTIRIDTAYNGSYYYFDGDVSMSGGLIDIPHNGMTIGSSVFAMTAGHIKLGFHFAALQPNSFLASDGTFEIVGSGTSQMNLADGCYFPKLVINKPDNQTACLNSDLLLKKSCEIRQGSLDLQGHKLTIDEDLHLDDTGYLLANQPNSEIWLKGSWINDGGTQNFYEGSSLVVMSPLGSSYIQNSETFYDLKIGHDTWSGSVHMFQTHTVNVSNNLEIDRYGFWLQENCSLNVSGNVSVTNDGYLVVQGSDAEPALANIAGDLTVNDSNFMIIRGAVSHQGHLITNPNSRIKAVLANYTNTAAGTWQLIDCQWEVSWDSSIEFSNKGIQLLTGSDVLLDSDCTFKTGKSFYATAEDLMDNWLGTLEFIGGTQSSIDLVASNELSDLKVNKSSASVVLQNDVVIRNDLNIISGSFNSNGFSVEIKGSWSNTAGPDAYLCGNSEVIFKYNRVNYSQRISGNQTFYDVRVNHTTNSTSLEDFGDSDITVLNDLIIERGNVDLHYLKAKNIHIPDDSYLKAWILELTGNVVDENPAIIDTYEERTGLIVSSALYLTGSDDQYLNIDAPGFGVYSLEIDKSGGAFKPGKPMLMNNLKIENGTWSYQAPGLIHTIYWNLEIGAGGSWADNTGTLVFDGNTDSIVKVSGTCTFNNIIVGKNEPARSVSLTQTDWNTGSTADFIIQQGIFQITGRSFQTGGNITVMSGGKLSLVHNASLAMHSSKVLSVQSGGYLETHGSDTQKALFTNVSGNNEFWIESGATISATNTIFEKAGYDGVYVMNGAYVDPEHSFTNCEFRYGFMFGTLLTINNNQHLTIENPVFITSDPPWGSTYNVSKTENWGSLTINGESGAFSGYLNEWDPFSRVNWSTDIPEFWANTTEIAFGEVTLGSEAFQLMDVINIGSAPLSGVIIVPEGFSAEPYGRFDPQTTSREASEVSKTELDTGSYRNSTLDFQIYPGGGMTYKVSFVPPLPGEYDANMVFYHNAPTSAHTVNLSGFSRGARIVTEPDTMRFELLPGISGTQILSIANAGNDSLGYQAYINYSSSRTVSSIVSESFEGSFPPTGWMETVVSGTNADWNISSNTVHPYGQPPHGGNQLAYFNSFLCTAGASSRLISPIFSLMSADPSELSFWMYHDSGYSTKADRIQVQISNDGISWNNLGQAVNRYSLEPGWMEHIFDLSAYSYSSNLRIGLLAISEYGNDIHIDDFHIYSIMPPTGWLSFNGAPDAMGTVFPGDEPDDISVMVNPESLDPGSYEAAIYIYSNDYLDWYRRIQILLTIGTPGVAFSEPYLSWDMVPVGMSVMQSISIQNPGAITLDATLSTTDSFAIVDPLGLRIDTSGGLGQSNNNLLGAKSGSQRADIQQQPSSEGRNTTLVSIPAGESIGINIAFSPAAVQGYTGTLLLSSDALPDASIGLYGTGVSSPSVQTLSVEAVTNQSALVNAVVENDGGMMLLERGVCFNTSGSPLYSDARISVEGNTGAYTCQLSTLNHSTQFFVRAFARNSQGISYGEELSFITLTPAVSLDLENLPDFGLVPLGTTSQEGSYSISGENLLMSIWLVVDENSGFAMSLTSAREPREFVNALELVPVDGSLPETTIHVVFCPSDTGFVEAAINGQSAGLSEPISIYLSGTGVRPPTVVNGIAFDITQTSATGSGLVIDNGLAPISSMGICWGTDPDPDLSGNIVSMDYEQGWYYCEMQDLEPNTQYYYRAFATNLAGTAYSTGEMFNTSFTPYIAFDESDYHAFGLLEVGATTEADTLHISGIGLGASVTVQAPEGFEISSTLEPLDRNFSSSVTLYPTTGTLEETPLYVRFSPDTAGPHSGYLSASSAGVDSQDLLLMGTGITLAEISTKPISEITSTSAVSGGIITFSGWCPSIAKGICWSIAPNPSLADYFTIDDEDPDFSSYLTGLQSNTTYYVRSYVTNQVGTAYGNNISFTTHVFALSIPQNVRLELDQNQIQLRWDPVENAVSYLVYRSSDPTAEDWGLPIAYTSETLWIDVDSSSKYFYRVVASTQLPSR